MISEEYKLFSSLIKEKVGLRLEPRDYKRVVSQVSKRVKKLRLKKFSEYARFLSTGNATAEWEELINEITVPETYFFRDKNQCDVLRDHILVGFSRSKREKRLRIWSAGCSTGEEAYTAAIIITQAIPDYKLWNIEIIGTDINQKSIEKARKGIYSKKSFRGVSEEIVDRYFNKKASGMSVNDPLRSLVKFSTFNMKLDEGFLFPYRYHEFDLIICRNVLIYFEKMTAKNILRGFYDSLQQDGYLLLGHSETSFDLKEMFQQIRLNDTFIYRKREPASHSQKSTVLTTHKEMWRQADRVKGGDWVSVHRHPAINKKRTLTNGFQPHVSSFSSEIRNTISVHYQNALTLYFQERFLEAESEIKVFLTHDSECIEGLLLASLIQINLGNFCHAKKCVQKIQQKDEFFPDAYFILGMIHESENNYGEAIRAYQSALFLNGNFFLAYFMLGYLYQKIGKIADSVHSFKNALKVIEAESEERVRLLSGGFSKRSFGEICGSIETDRSEKKFAG
ncbi:MAG: CheR family methyltransferase [Thermodesulfobacteriota bacterium]|nr:CheR family methyltransferase [Thermodesulfobacteriota bacterium]